MANPVLQREWGEKQDDSAATERVTPTTEAMTIGGTSAITAFLLLILLIAGAWGWSLTVPGEPWPVWLFVVVIGSAILAIVAIFQPPLARFVSPVYAAGQGLALGAISRIYEAAFNGIVFQAILATVAVFVVMLFLYVTRIIKVTNRTRGVIIGATFGIALFYIVSLLFSLFGAAVPLIWDTGWAGILFSAFVVVIAAFNLMLDFDLIERGTAAGAPKYMEWFAALGLLITIVWLYLEMLRLLGKVRS